MKAYPLLVPLLKNPREKAHILLKEACHAIQKKDYHLAHTFCKQANTIYEDSFLDRLIDLDLLSAQEMPSKKPTKKKLLDMAVLYEKKNLPSLMIKTYRMLAQLDYDPSYYEKIITGYDQIQKSQKALKWTLGWLFLLLEKQEWQQAEKVALQALTRTQEKISLYEQLETIYTHWHGHELNDLWGKLGKAYLQNGELARAEMIYEKAFKRFNSFEHAVALADTLIKQDKKALGVQKYYQASSIALLKNRVEDLSLCVKSIKEVDPEMEHLKLSQRMMLLTQSRILELSNEVKLLKEKIDIPPLPVIATPEIRKKAPFPAIAFGKAEWAKYFGDVGVEPPLPADINAILSAPCPFWSGKKVKRPISSFSFLKPSMESP